jgi:acyl carrier protein
MEVQKENNNKMSDIKYKIREFVIENFLFGNANGLEDDTSFLEEGIIDSTGVLELVTFIEEKFKIEVDDDELVPENLDSINNVVSYLERKMG